ncbi:hypothetical protein KEM48_014107 [Puccinia striiformis f. sp. tritici PST-130]|nr:hypothetical protein KEM48_014107 [Puccinia striiformis f. sp. tritici PST-130]
MILDTDTDEAEEENPGLINNDDFNMDASEEDKENPGLINYDDLDTDTDEEDVNSDPFRPT